MKVGNNVGQERFLELPSTKDSIRRLNLSLLEFLHKYSVSHEDVFDIRVAVEEAAVNGVVHGNKLDSSKKIRALFRISNGSFEAVIEDEGNGFSWETLPDPTERENILKNGGRGVYLIKRLMDEVEFNERGNRLRMVKKIHF